LVVKAENPAGVALSRCCFLPTLSRVEVISSVNINVSMASRPDVFELFIPWKLLLLLQLLNNFFDINRVPDNHCIRYQIQTTNLIVELLVLLFSNFSLVCKWDSLF
jgi:hypothetical protein